MDTMDQKYCGEKMRKKMIALKNELVKSGNQATKICKHYEVNPTTGEGLFFIATVVKTKDLGILKINEMKNEL